MMARSVNACILCVVPLLFQQGVSLALPAEGSKRTGTHPHKIHGSPSADPEVLAKRVEQPTGRPDKNETAAAATGVATNAAGDLDAFLAALVTNVVTIVVMWLAASFLRKRYPLVYSKNTLTLCQTPELKDEYEKNKEDMDEDLKKVLQEPWVDKIGTCLTDADGKAAIPEDSLFSWWSASASVTIDKVIEFRGLDIGMLLEFSQLAMKISLYIGLPLVLIVGPCHCFFGGYRAGAPGTAEADYLSYWGMANVVDEHPWLYWAHTLVMWIVIVAVQRMLYNAMRAFLVLRRDWLLKMPDPRATTVLVEGIPEDRQTDEKLHEYFDEIFGDKVVQRALIVKYAPELSIAATARDAARAEVDKLKHKKSKLARDESASEELNNELTTKEDALNNCVQAFEEAKKDVQKKLDDNEERKSVVLSKGFVTFKNRRDAELSKMLAYVADAHQWVVETPPDPSDVRWADLQVDPFWEQIWAVLGYALIAGVYWAYLPTVIAIAYYSSLETLAEYSSVFKSLAEDPSISALWDGLVNALALQLFIGFVPTFFMLIFSHFFCVKAGAALQFKIQNWYFYFQVIFVLLVTAIGSSLLGTMKELAEDPTSIVYLLASTLPLASHFYLNYLPLQWVTHAQNMLRLANFFKFKFWGAVFGDCIAVKKGEPEDQDYYGLGSRSARFTFMLVLGLTFCTLSPLITILCFINFWVCRKCYGYLCVFCETKKPDLGGCFYVSQLRHVSEGLFIYIILMTGVLLERDRTVWPGLISASGLIFQYLSYNRFKTTFRWENLNFEDLRDLANGTLKDNNGDIVKVEKRDPTGDYKQEGMPEMDTKP